MSLNSKGLVLATLESSRLAEEIIEEVIERAEKEGQSERIRLITMQNLAILKEQNNNLEGLRNIYFKLLDNLANENNSVRLIDVFNNLGGNYLDAGLYDSARTWFDSVYNLSLEAKIIAGLDEIINNQ